MAGLALRLAGATAGAGAEAAGTAVSGAATSCFRNLTSGIPHPTECGCIGAVWYFLGCHDHRKFNLLLELHELDRLPKGAQVYLVVKSGRWTATSQVVKEQKNGRALVEERLFLHVRQADDNVKFYLYKKGVLKSDCIATLSVKVKAQMIDAKFPKRTWYIMSCTSGAVNPQINMSFYKMDSSVPASQSPVMQQAYLMAQQEADEKGEKFELDMSKMTQKQRLEFLSRVLEGPLERVSSYGFSEKDLYFKAVEIKPDKWEWCYWASKEACKAKEPPKGSIPFLAVSLVVPDRNNRNTFYLRYLDKNHQQHDCFFRRKDRDRNLWSEGLFEFIEKLRNYREMCAATGKIPGGAEAETTAEGRANAQAKKEKKKKNETAASGNEKKKSSRTPSPSPPMKDIRIIKVFSILLCAAVRLPVMTFRLKLTACIIVQLLTPTSYSPVEIKEYGHSWKKTTDSWWKKPVEKPECTYIDAGGGDDIYRAFY